MLDITPLLSLGSYSFDIFSSISFLLVVVIMGCDQKRFATMKQIFKFILYIK